MTDSEVAAFRARYPDIAVYNENAIMSTPEFKQFKAMNPGTFEITEIKGTNNRTDFENAPYLKQIQQQIKNLDSQFNLQDVENLDKIGMVKITNDSGVKAIGDEMIRLNNGSQYVNKDDFEKLSRQAFTNMLTPPQQRAKGGMVERQSTDNRRYM
jgi:hypothetical protein